MADEPLVTRTYKVTEKNGTVHTIRAEHFFDNEEEAMFRVGPRGKTHIKAVFRWDSISSIVMESEDEAR